MSSESGTHLNMNILSYHYRNSHHQDKAVSWPSSYLYNGNPILGKTIFILRWGPDLYHNLVIVGLYVSCCVITLEWSCCHHIFIIGCHFENFRCSQWQNFYQNNDISDSVHVCIPFMQHMGLCVISLPISLLTIVIMFLLHHTVIMKL